MEHLKKVLFILIANFVMIPLTLFAVPHEPSPAGGGWCELNLVSQIESESHWFPDYSGPLTLEAWIYIENPPSIQNAFSLVGQTGRFSWAILGLLGDSNFDGVRDSIGGILNQNSESDEVSGMINAHLPARQWVHYVAIIDNGVTLGSNGFITGKSPGVSLAANDNRLIIGGVPILKETMFPEKQKTLPTSGVYIDELRVSCIVRYESGKKYLIPKKAFTPDADTLGLYHFDDQSIERYEDTSKYRIALIRSKKNAEFQRNRQMP